MEHLYESPHLAQSLQKWAAGEELRILCFYFWNAASDIQMSLQRLVRTLLFQALEQNQQYIPLCFPSRFETRLMFPDEVIFRPPLMWDELLDGLKAYLQEASKEKKLFLLLDGLDEFGGQPLEIIDFVSTLPGHRVKVCVSSRPWVAFEDAFGSKPSLRLHDYTKNDVRSYVEVNFRANPGFIAREQLDPEYAAKIVDNVSEKASGVFLWVSLVVRSLMEGFSGGERLSDLQERQDELPSDLEELFLNILDKLNAKQLRSSAQFFQMMRLARRQISNLEFSFADEESAERIYKMEIKPMSARQIEARVEILRRRVNECCKGLMELSTQQGKVKPHEPVNYLHRTVGDFWNKPENKKRLVNLQGDGFNPYTRLCLARIAMLKTTPFPENEDFWGYLMYGIGYAKAAEGRANSHLPEMFTELGRVAISLDDAAPDKARYLRNWSPAIQQNVRDVESLAYRAWPWKLDNNLDVPNFLPLGTILRLKSYLDFLVASSHENARISICSMALHYTLLPRYRVTEKYSAIIDVAEGMTTYDKDGLIKMLLKCGADPNHQNPATGRTAWET